MTEDESPLTKFKKELGSVYNRWWEESDLDEMEMTDATVEVLDKVLGTTIEFESEIDIEEETE
jgi:hypothetical protein